MTVAEQGNYWIIEASGQQARINQHTLEIAVTEHGSAYTWTTVEHKDQLLIRKQEGTGNVNLSSARNKQFKPYISGYFQGIQLTLSQFSLDGEQLDLEIQLLILLYEYSHELVCELLPIRAGADRIEHIAWPAPFEFKSKRDDDYTVVPMMQGYLVPASWEGDLIRYEDGIMHGRDSYMPWWGQTIDNHGYIAIVDTPWDAKSHLDHCPSVHSRFSLCWLNSRGEFPYIRRVKYVFEPDMGYAGMAKRYRDYVKSKGRFRSLAEKMAENPVVRQLQGAAVVNTLIHFYTMPESDYYDLEHPENNDQRNSFQLRAEQLKRLKELYDEPVYVHIDGWGIRGYDNLHPDILPPSPVCGGWEGLQYLQQTCRELDYTLALHDQYRDFYHDAASYNAELAVRDLHGNNELCTIWPGGAHHFLSAGLAKGYIDRNYELLKQGGIEPDGVYLDVFAVVALEEDYHSAHIMTRKDCMEHRLSCFHSIRSRQMIVSSEEPVDWAIPALDLVHHGPYALIPNPGKGPAIGIPVPLFSLVYHDAVFLPWVCEEGEGGWGIPETDWGFLHGLLNAGLPILEIEPSEGQIALAKQMSMLHSRIGCLEMITHEFIEGDYRRQRTVYADGTVVAVNFETRAYTVQYSEA